MSDSRNNEKKLGGIILAPSCINNCIFCRSVSKISSKEIRLQEIKVLKNIIEFKKNPNIGGISISGNDPLEYEKIDSLIKYIKKQGFSEILLATHGLMLDDFKFTKKLINSGLLNLEFQFMVLILKFMIV